MHETILVVDDDREIVGAIALALEKEGYRVLRAYDGMEALDHALDPELRLILMDVMMPRLDGLSAVMRIRDRRNLPIIVLSARTQEQEKVRALDLGADDYLTKPIGTSELLARIRTALRHSNRLNTDSPLYKRPFHARGLTIDFEKHLVSVDGKDVHLTQIEFKIISLLAQNSGRVMTYDTIISNIWGPYADDDNSILRVNMAHIRRKLEQNPAEPQYVFTEIGIGYRMIEDEMQ